jgi:hypothetical protein
MSERIGERSVDQLGTATSCFPTMVPPSAGMFDPTPYFKKEPLAETKDYIMQQVMLRIKAESLFSLSARLTTAPPVGS